MNLAKKKFLVMKTLGVGRDRVIFNVERLEEIKEAITKQDIRELAKNGAIAIKEIKGTRSKPKRKTRRRAGSIRNRAINKKRVYITITRKLRKHLNELRGKGKISRDQFYSLRKEIRARRFSNKPDLKERITEITSK